MILDEETSVPYAPYANILMILRHARDKGLKEPVTAKSVTTLGIPEGNATRATQTLRFLKLLDEEGYLTERSKLLSKAPSEEYPGLLEQVLRDAYPIVFNALEPATATDQQYTNAFRLYEPGAQRHRMITLFKGLCREAGLIAGGSPEVAGRPRPTSGKSNKSQTSSNGAKRTGRPEPKDATFDSEPHRIWNTEASQTVSEASITSLPDYAMMHGVLKKLPFEKKQWTQPEREKWLNAVTAMVDMLFTLQDPQTGMGMEDHLYHS
jgi:Family of unknown function (DUF5343)